MDPLTLLPAECWRSIFRLLTASEARACAAVCRAWRELIAEEELWRHLYEEEYFDIEGGAGVRCCNVLGAAAAPASDGPTVPAASAAAERDFEAVRSWRAAYRDAAETRANWRTGRHGCRQLRGHTDFIRCAQFSGNMLVTAASSVSMNDCSLRVWDMDEGVCRAVLTGHTGPIWCMDVLENGLVATGSADGTVRLWDARAAFAAAPEAPVAGAFEVSRWTLPGADVRGVSLDARGGAIAACDGGGGGNGVVLWRLPDGDGDAEKGEGAPPAAPRKLRSAPSPRAGVHSPGYGALQLRDGLCAALADTGGFHMWALGDEYSAEPHFVQLQPGLAAEMHSLSFETVFGVTRVVAGCGHAQGFQMQPLSNAVLVVRVLPAAGTTLAVTEAVLSGHSRPVFCHQQGLPGEGETIISGSADSTARIWDVRSPPAAACTATLLGHGAGVNCLQATDMIVTTGAADGEIITWDRRTGRPLQRYPGHRERVWALQMDAHRLVSAALDARVFVRSFLPDALRFARWRACAACGRRAPLVACSACPLQAYCSEECEAADWTLHRRFCPGAERATHVRLEPD